MLNFHKPSIADYGWIHDITYPANLPGVDMSFHNMYFWSATTERSRRRQAS